MAHSPLRALALRPCPLALALLLLALSALACSSAPPPADGGPPLTDLGAPLPDAGAPAPCAVDADCVAPDECWDGECVPPSAEGGLCREDAECEGQDLCLAGRCEADPRVATTCSTDDDCRWGLACDDSGTCACRHDVDCPASLLCREGACVGLQCVADEECPLDRICEGGTCLDPALCPAREPDLSGVWAMTSRLDVRGGLPRELETLLEAVEGPFAFLAGEAACLDFGLPDWVERELCTLLRPFVEATLPPWSQEVFLAVSDLGLVLAEWEVTEELTLERGDVRDSYRGAHVWSQVVLRDRDATLTGRPEEILAWRFEPSPFDATASCGTFRADRHAVELKLGSVVAWAVDEVIGRASDGRWGGLEDALDELTAGFCEALAQGATELFDVDGLADAVAGLCRLTLGGLVEDALGALVDARLGTDAMVLRGEAPTRQPEALAPGRWDGAVLGRSFPGAFCAVRESEPACAAPDPAPRPPADAP
ncbi:MAG: hypothetical protein ACFCGT_06365 [Sandaracinaceae bacterium]